MQQIYHNKNEKQEVEFFQDKECTIPFDFKSLKEYPFYYLHESSVLPFLFAELYSIAKKQFIDGERNFSSDAGKQLLRRSSKAVCVPYLPQKEKLLLNLYHSVGFVEDLYQTGKCGSWGFYDEDKPWRSLVRVLTLDDITPNLSKYIPKDNAVLFLSEEDKSKFSVNEFSQNVFNRTPLVSQYWIDRGDFPRNLINGYFNDNNSTYTINDENKGVHPIYRKLTIFLPHGTQSELEKANEIEKELKEKYGVEEVNLFALHWFSSEYQKNSFEIEYFCQDFGTLKNINKIITTNSTGILKPEDSKERFQVIDCKEIFEEYLKESN